MRLTIGALLAACIAMLMAAMTLASCKSSSDTPGQSAPESAPESAEPPPPPSGGNADRVAALEEAWNTAADCQLLARCCAGVGGTSWEQTLQPFCQQVQDLQNFEQQVENLVDPAWQTTDCRNRVTALSGMGNSANPLPPACAATP
jgi:hypothetical protein